MVNRELFRRDDRLVVQMILAAVLTPVIVVALLVVMLLLLPTEIFGGIALAIAIGAAIAGKERRHGPQAKALRREEAPELYATVERLCVVADLAMPELVLESERQPNSWVVAPPGRPAHLHVTRALLELLDADELAAVLSHELSHLANRDAMVMTVVGMPGVVLEKGSSRGFGFWPLQIGMLIACLIGQISRVGTNALSRCRELTADAGAAAITGRPSALASALMKVSGAIEQVPRADLRAVAGRDGFHLIAVARGDDAGRVKRFMHATHPPLERRIQALERLESGLHDARPALPPR